MSESRRSHAAAPLSTATRDSRTDTLLVEGLDHYFAGNYNEAIHLWTRVLFLDRSHARARAYISRARTALAERQRRADEALHLVEDLLGRGDLDRARALLAEAERAAGADEKAAGLWARLDRLERTRIDRRVEQPSSAIVDAVPLRPWRWNLRAAARAVATAACGALIVTAASSPAVRAWLTGGVDPATAVPAPRARTLPVLSTSDVALVRAETLFKRGRLAEALRALERVDPASPSRDAADAVRMEIQRWLFRTTRPMDTEVVPMESEP